MPQTELTGFAEELKSARKQAGISQDELAAALGIRQSTVSSWELGTKEPSRDNVRRVEETLGVPTGSLSSLLGWVAPDADHHPLSRKVVAVPDTTRAIMADKTLDKRGRSLLLQLYRTLSDGGSDMGMSTKRCIAPAAA